MSTRTGRDEFAVLCIKGDGVRRVVFCTKPSRRDAEFVVTQLANVGLPAEIARVRRGSVTAGCSFEPRQRERSA